MSLRCLSLAAVLAWSACGGGDSKESREPTTAREKLRQEAKKDKDGDAAPTKNWGKWRYSGDSESCFFRLGAKCFKTEAAACSAARCKKPATCTTEGAAPAQVSCK